MVALLWVKLPLWGIETSLGLPTVLTGFDKTFLSLTRLLHILSLAYLIVAIPVLSNLARTSPEHPLAVLGKHSLPVFIAGTILAMIAQVMKIGQPRHGAALRHLLLSTGIALQFGLRLLSRMAAANRLGRQEKAADQPPTQLPAGAALKPGVTRRRPISLDDGTPGSR